MAESERGEVLASWAGPKPGSNRRLGMIIFLVSLSMFFAVGIVCYLLYRLNSSASAGMAPVHLPAGIWLSTVLLAVTGWSVYRSTQMARSGHFSALRQWLMRTWVLGFLFVAVQIPSMAQLLRVHQFDVAAGYAGAYGIAFVLILLHAVHVVGGLIPLTILARKARAGKLDSESLPSVKACASYWHFLEVVWVVLLLTLVLAG